MGHGRIGRVLVRVPLRRKLGALGCRIHVEGVSLVVEAGEDPAIAVEMSGQSLDGTVYEDCGISAVTGGEAADCRSSRVSKSQGCWMN